MKHIIGFVRLISPAIIIISLIFLLSEWRYAREQLTDSENTISFISRVCIISEIPIDARQTAQMFCFRESALDQIDEIILRQIDGELHEMHSILRRYHNIERIYAPTRRDIERILEISDFISMLHGSEITELRHISSTRYAQIVRGISAESERAAEAMIRAARGLRSLF